MKKRKSRPPVKHKKVPIKIYLFALVFFMAVTVVHCFNLYRTARAYTLKQEEVNSQIQIEQAINNGLREDLENVNNGSDAFIEKEAREKLGLVMPNEIIFYNVGN